MMSLTQMHLRGQASHRNVYQETNLRTHVFWNLISFLGFRGAKNATGKLVGGK